MNTFLKETFLHIDPHVRIDALEKDIKSLTQERDDAVNALKTYKTTEARVDAELRVKETKLDAEEAQHSLQQLIEQAALTKAAEDRAKAAEADLKAAEDRATKAQQELNSYKAAETMKDSKFLVEESARDAIFAKTFSDQLKAQTELTEKADARALKAEKALAQAQEALATHQKADEAAEAEKQRQLAQASERAAKAQKDLDAYKANDALEDAERDLLLAAAEMALANEHMLLHGLASDFVKMKETNVKLGQRIHSLRLRLHEYESEIIRDKAQIVEANAIAEKAKADLQVAYEKHKLEIAEEKRKSEDEKARFEAWQAADKAADEQREKQLKEMHAQIDKEEAEHKKFMEYIAKDAKSDAKREEVLHQVQAELSKKQVQVRELTTQLGQAKRDLEKAKHNAVTLDHQYHHALDQKKAGDAKLHTTRQQLAEERVKYEVKDQAVTRLQGAIAKHHKEIQELNNKVADGNSKFKALTTTHDNLHKKVASFTGALADLHRLCHAA